jgi:ubiquinone biosynthesis protein
LTFSVQVVRGLLRSLWLAVALSIFLLGLALQGVLRFSYGPRMLRWFLERSGGGLLKVGQLLSMRIDILPRRYFEEMIKLLDRGRPVPVAAVRRTIEEDLGRPIAELFSAFDDEPVAAASIAVVHRARLRDGRDVAIKVRRPEAPFRFRADLRLLWIFAVLADLTNVLGARDLKPLVRELSRMTLLELDFRREALNTQLLHERMKADTIRHFAPAVIFSHSGPRVLTLEWIDGVWVTELLDAVQNNDRRRLDAWAKRGITPRRVGRILFRSTMAQFEQFRHFHADPHAANLVVRDGCHLGYVDFGIVGTMDERIWAEQRRVFTNMARGRVHGTTQAILATATSVPVDRLRVLEDEVKTLVGDWMLAASSPYSSKIEKSNGRLLLQIGECFRRANARPPLGVTTLYRTKIISDMVVYTLFPDMDPVAEMAEAVAERRSEEVSQLFTAARWYQLLAAALALPDLVETAIERAQTNLASTASNFTRLAAFERAAMLFLRYVSYGLWALVPLALFRPAIVLQIWPASLTVDVISAGLVPGLCLALSAHLLARIVDRSTA